jgi:hypothetical protein
MERILTTLPAANDEHRTTVVEVVDADGNVSIELRNETLLESLGWVTQKRICLDADSIKNLQCALNLFIGDTRKQDTSSNLVSLDTFRNRRKAG